jgi:manganese-transporting P-type ATPase
MVKPGDASMASPFTAKEPSIMPCTDIIKQGRSTLVTTVQMFKILGLLCLSTAYSLSVMYLEGVKLGNLQVGHGTHGLMVVVVVVMVGPWARAGGRV